MEENKENKPKEKRKGVGVNGNLIPASMRSKEELQELSRKGKEAYRKKREVEKNMMEIARALLNTKMKESKVKEILGDSTELLQGDYSLSAVLIMKQIMEAQEGSTKAAEFIRDTSGNKPVERQEITADIMTDADRELLAKVAKRQGITGDSTQ